MTSFLSLLRASASIHSCNVTNCRHLLKVHICQIKSGFHFLHTDPNFKTCLCGIRKQSVIKVPTAQTNSLKSIDIALYVDFRE